MENKIIGNKIMGNKIMGNKLFILSIFMFLLFANLCSARDVCPDFCDGNVYNFNGEYNERTGSCDYETEMCGDGCSVEGCVEREEECNDYCSREIHYYDGEWANGECEYDTEDCVYGCDEDECAEPADCSVFCEGGIYYYNGIPNAQGGCNYAESECISEECENDGSACLPVDCSDFCENEIMYWNGYYDTEEEECIYIENNCMYGCELVREPDECACPDSCDGDTLKHNGEYTKESNSCTFTLTTCEYGCENGECLESSECPTYCDEDIPYDILYYDGAYSEGNPLAGPGCYYTEKTCYADCADDEKSCEPCNLDTQCPSWCDDDAKKMHAGKCGSNGECSWVVTSCGQSGCNEDETACSLEECSSNAHCQDSCENGILTNGYCVDGSCIYLLEGCEVKCNEEGTACEGCTGAADCPNKCEEDVAYTGKCDIALEKCFYTAYEDCWYGCNEEETSCGACIADSDCLSEPYCFQGKISESVCDTNLGYCVEQIAEECPSDCHPTKSATCGIHIGDAFFTNQAGVVLPIKNALVTAIWYDNEGDVLKELQPRATTSTGNIIFSENEKYMYSMGTLEITITLHDFNNRFEILYGNNVFDAVNWKLLTANAPNFTYSIEVDPSDPGTYNVDFDFNTIADGDRFAKIYYHNYEAVEFSENGLGVPVDHLPPVAVYVDGNYGCSACYYGQCNPNPTWEWGIFYDPGNSGFMDGSSPHNLEWHEFCHHIMADSSYIPCLSAGDGNHNGFANSESRDSWIEGWAEFCSLMIKDYYAYPNPHMYGGLNMEVGNTVQGEEEIAVASALWDLYDSGPGGDGIDLSRDQIWNILGSPQQFPGEANPRLIDNFYDIYVAFDQSGLLGIHGDVDGDGINNWDEIFILRECYADDDGNGNWDAGEDIGYTLDAAGNPRFADFDGKQAYAQRPEKNGSYLKFDIADEDGNSVENCTIFVDVVFNADYNNGENWDFAYSLPLEGSQIYFEQIPEQYNSTVEVTALCENKTADGAFFNSIDFAVDYNPEAGYVYEFEMVISEGVLESESGNEIGNGNEGQNENQTESGTENGETTSTEEKTNTLIVVIAGVVIIAVLAWVMSRAKKHHKK